MPKTSRKVKLTVELEVAISDEYEDDHAKDVVELAFEELTAEFPNIHVGSIELTP